MVRAEYNPRTVGEVFRDFAGRRMGLIRALTTDVEEFLNQCDRERKEDLCLYGLEDQWEVRVRVPEVAIPPEIPEPTLGINVTNNRTDEWLITVARHSDCWLLSVAFYFAGKFDFDKSDREWLFSKMSELPSVLDVVRESLEKKSIEKTLVSEAVSSKSAKDSETMLASEEDGGLEEEGEHGDTLCAACGEKILKTGFGCSEDEVKHMKDYKCPACSLKTLHG